MFFGFFDDHFIISFIWSKSMVTVFYGPNRNFLVPVGADFADRSQEMLYFDILAQSHKKKKLKRKETDLDNAKK